MNFPRGNDPYIKIKNYTLIDEIGSGTFGTVYLCVNETGDKRAIKKLSIKDSVDVHNSYIREVRLLQVLGNHPNIAQYYNSEIIRRYGYIEQEYVQGVDVEILMALFGRTNQLFCVKFAETLLSGLNHLHINGIYHRDLNYNNVLVCLDPDDENMPLMVKIIDLGIGCRFNDINGASCANVKGDSLFTWPYDPSLFNDVPTTQETLVCNDIWQAGSLVYHVAYGDSFRRFNPNVSGFNALYFFGQRMSKKGGYPVPPNDIVNVMDPELYNDIVQNDLLEEQAIVVSTYSDYVIHNKRDPVYDFDIGKVSFVHDLIRLMLSRSVKDCFNTTELLAYIKAEWHDAQSLGPRPQRANLNNCHLPCEDPSNSYYESNCKKCQHCRWDDKGIMYGSHTAHCVPIEINSRSEQERRDCLFRGGIWNPYRKNCEFIGDETNKYLSNRYSILFMDDPVSGAEIKRRVKSRDYRKLLSDKLVLEKLKNFSYHPLQTIASHSFFYDYFQTRVSPDYSDYITRPGMTEFVELQDARLDDMFGKKSSTRNTRKSTNRITYKDPMTVKAAKA